MLTEIENGRTSEAALVRAESSKCLIMPPLAIVTTLKTLNLGGGPGRFKIAYIIILRMTLQKERNKKPHRNDLDLKLQTFIPRFQNRPFSVAPTQAPHSGIFNGLVGIPLSDSYKFPEAAVRRSHITCAAIRLVIIWVMKHVLPPLPPVPLPLSLSISFSKFSFTLCLKPAMDGA